ncbi:hypothetical protein [Sphaerisporangium sp. TRM90804]|uniref:hypothetical protein n=1 Tax=Sphaerisporangium sp. TRM90804 TaxID=3031113 RepID=UPI00244D2F58|nr:hypothetical protein [Sphaerisporangium sp. TRM90804]MDH2426394.1 hypothetical protein [Sphaerisporangium sp. TRM90804]
MLQSPGSRSDDHVTSTLERAIKPLPSGAFWSGLAGGVLLAAGTALLIVQNDTVAAMEWLTLDFAAPLWLFLLVSAVSGAVLTLLVLVLWRRGRLQAHRRREAARDLRRMTSHEDAPPPSGPDPSPGGPVNDTP